MLLGRLGRWIDRWLDDRQSLVDIRVEALTMAARVQGYQSCQLDAAAWLNTFPEQVILRRVAAESIIQGQHCGFAEKEAGDRPLSEIFKERVPESPTRQEDWWNRPLRRTLPFVGWGEAVRKATRRL